MENLKNEIYTHKYSFVIELEVIFMFKCFFLHISRLRIFLILIFHKNQIFCSYKIVLRLAYNDDHMP